MLAKSTLWLASNYPMLCWPGLHRTPPAADALQPTLRCGAAFGATHIEGKRSKKTSSQARTTVYGQYAIHRTRGAEVACPIIY
jgi:hypothetical protein